MSKHVTQQQRTIEGLQYLRGIAALMVVFFHARSYFGEVPDWTRIGSRGVDIFFVISGFIMMYTTRHCTHEVSPWRAAGEFLGKRFVRVVPLYWIALLWAAWPYFSHWIAGADSLAALAAGITPDLASIFKDFAFIPHPSLDEEEMGEMFPVLIQGWTLNYEVVFYLLFGIGMLSGQYRVVLVSAVLAGAVVAGKLLHFSGDAGRFYTSPILLEFIFGMVVYEIHSRSEHLRFSRLTLLFLGVLGCLLLVTGSAANDKVVLGSAAALIVWLSIQLFRGVRSFPLQLLGDASYSIYLFHLATSRAARQLVQDLGLTSANYTDIALAIGINMALAVGLGIVIYYSLERPLLSLLRRRLRKTVAADPLPALLPAASGK